MDYACELCDVVNPERPMRVLPAAGRGTMVLNSRKCVQFLILTGSFSPFNRMKRRAICALTITDQRTNNPTLFNNTKHYLQHELPVALMFDEDISKDVW